MIFIHEPESLGESKESELLRSDFQAWINKCVACTQASAYFCRIPIRTGTGRDLIERKVFISSCAYTCGLRHRFRISESHQWPEGTVQMRVVPSKRDNLLWRRGRLCFMCASMCKEMDGTWDVIPVKH